MFGFKKGLEPVTKTKYKFDCPHCGKENIQEFRDDMLWRQIGFECQHCDKPLARIRHPHKGLCIYPLYQIKEAKTPEEFNHYKNPSVISCPLSGGALGLNCIQCQGNSDCSQYHLYLYATKPAGD